MPVLVKMIPNNNGIENNIYLSRIPVTGEYIDYDSENEARVTKVIHHEHDWSAIALKATIHISLN